ncbi:MAG TPA: hypothetical protein VL381_08050, partial [Rhodocyclaceae bacterium]|nr:hypothetical protein [Rhodocyclaceae bacterium]
MTIYRALLMVVMVCLTACAGGPAKSDLIYYDLGAATEVLPTPLRGLDVVPSSWLASNAMYYRLAYVDGNRREHFANTRWTAQPAELLGVRLHQSLIANAEKTALTCRMRIELDDFVQVF